ncbi:MAG: aminodeoxychorismate/anthranilate synthase component II [Thermodesulfobacteriota bacterium]|jgi:anthranilate synthase/aminodeoxychorismate synthase-like glutamine amidotransferase|nr:MAG: aminodeoxychorismate/anthranilate synthase component II [Thermodesulfobacteriota bacterium]
MILVIDNYDSFTYNLVQYLGQLGEKTLTYRNDQISLEQVENFAPHAILLSPGPKTPAEAGICVEVIKRFHEKIPLLGVCLGHQSIGFAFGGKIVKAKSIMHGKTSAIYHDQKTIFRGIPSPFEAIRYHSLVIERKSLPDCLEITAHTDDNEIMGVRHKKYPVEGIQFHPESILTPNGKRILRNFLKLKREAS